jgi:hypothetical protein
MAHSTHKTVCPHDCPDTCSILATVEDGRVTDLGECSTLHENLVEVECAAARRP